MSTAPAIVLTGYLAIAAVIDIAKKKLPVVFLVLGVIPAGYGIVSAVLCADTGDIRTVLLAHAIGTAIGLSFLIICLITRDKLGKADAILFTVCGATTGYETLITLIMSAFLLSAVYAVAMLAVGKMNRKSSFAFAPFIMLGYIMTEVLIHGI
ncbi:MAG: prepilin peptidase [Lachnospiraceae bacterium]|nr:prepilin peptidase [Lachnospiraceae bacterium]